MPAKLFEVMTLLEQRGVHFSIERTGPYDVQLMATLVGKRVEITVDEDDIINVSISRGDESVEVGMDAVLKAIEDDA
jgi:hypothetical protein